MTTRKLSDLHLSAFVSLDDGTGKVKCVSRILIRVGPLLVASAVLGGRYSQQQALREFKQDCKRPANQQRFKPGSAYKLGMSLCAA